MSTTAIYIKSIEIRNIRTFGNVVLDLDNKDGALSKWTLILGDNGIGKSTLLQCIAWMKPNIPDLNAPGEKIDREDIEPNINNEENETLVRLVRKTKNKKESASVKAKFITNRLLNRQRDSKKDTFCETAINIELLNGKLNDFKADFDLNSNVFYSNEVTIFAYSASRHLGKLNMSDVELEDTIHSFIAEETVLYDANEILHTINYAALGAERNEKAKYEHFISKVKDMMVTILPDFENINDIEISAPKLINNKIEQQEISITTRHGNKIPFSNFSLGYKTVVSWTVDLAWRLFNKYPKSKDPLSEAAIVLIDEIDLHLHPLWQRQIIDNLSNHFPNVQFIATAHSPLMVQAAFGANYAILKYNENGVQVINEPEGIDGWRVDQILTSEFFGVKTSRGIKYERLINRREELAKKRKLILTENEELAEINRQLSELPTGETPEEIENRKLIADVVAKIKKNKIKIEL